jgi:hypothetical protein
MPHTRADIDLPLKTQTAEELTHHGFPDFVTAGFLRTADEVAAAVMTRVPGPATTQLIAERHDLKGFRIKAKSCDWGPMAGFVCELPPFNKAGASKIGHNEESNIAYDTSLLAEYRAQPSTIRPEDSVVRPPPYLPLKISKASKDKAIEDAGSQYVEIDDETILGFVHDLAETVYAEILMKREFVRVNGADVELWALHPRTSGS